MDRKIQIRGAREHNLVNVNLELPRNRLICFTGVSGSGKSSLAFDTLYAEGQRRYIESLSSFARQFLGQTPKPDVDFISGLSPAISIAQKTAGNNPRSTVGTMTEIYDFLRVLYARIGVGHCPVCGKTITAQTRQQILGKIVELGSRQEELGSRQEAVGSKKEEKPAYFLFLAPKAYHQKGEFKDLFEDLRRQGCARVRVDGVVRSLQEDIRLDRQMRHNIEVVIDRLELTRQNRPRMLEAVEESLKAGGGEMILASSSGGEFKDIRFSSQYACPTCGLSFSAPTPQMFSFNSPQGACPECNGLGEVYTFDPSKLAIHPELPLSAGPLAHLPPIEELGRWRKSIYLGLANYLEKKYNKPAGYVFNTPWQDLDDKISHAILWGTGEAKIEFSYKSASSEQKWGGTYDGLIPMLLSTYNSLGATQKRQFEKYMANIPCGHCEGERLNVQARHVKLQASGGKFDGQWLSLPQACALSVEDVRDFFSHLQLTDSEKVIASDALKEILGRLSFLSDVGLGYLTLGRTAPTLSGGEMQRIRLAGQIGCGLTGVLYILDEPSIGLHSRDNVRLLNSLSRLRDQGNTVVVVEHDEETMRSADMLVDFGPGAGSKGGRVVASGDINNVMSNPDSITGAYLAGRKKIAIPVKREKAAQPQPQGRGLKYGSIRKGKASPAESSAEPKSIIVRGAKHHNLKNIDVEFPLGKFICVTGVSGSGKSSLVNGILVEALHRDLNRGAGFPGEHDKIEGLENLDKMIAINQSPIGRTPRSNPATYTKLFDEIRDLYASLPEAKAKGFKSGRFSFNVQGGRCEACQGAGAEKLEMDFLADIWTTCPVCNGKRFNAETLSVEFKGKSIADVLEMDVDSALEHFVNIPKIYAMLKTLHDVGLGYMKIGQPSPTLSGGEAQRIKLAKELIKIATGRTLYMLDEPTTGLHFSDIDLLLKVLHNFVDLGNTVIVIEHNLDVVKTADWVIELGPDGGAGGGELIFAGTPEQMVKTDTPTGIALRPVLDQASKPPLEIDDVKKLIRKSSKQKTDLEKAVAEPDVIHVEGAAEHNLKSVDVDIARNKLTVLSGPSGSGKSSMAIDTIYAEGQRRYVESLSSYARQFVGQMTKPKVDLITGLSPAIAIEQKRTTQQPRSTVGTVSEIYDYVRILLARLGQPYCPHCQIPVGTQSPDEIINRIMNYPEGTKVYILAPINVEVGRKYEDVWDNLRSKGFARVRLDGVVYSLNEMPEDIDRRRRWNVEVLVDRTDIQSRNRSRIASSVETALNLGKGEMRVTICDPSKPESRWKTDSYSQHFACPKCGESFTVLTPNHFSFNSPLGWCPDCEGLGTQWGADLSVFVEDDKLSLAQGAVNIFPNASGALFKRMLAAFEKETSVPINVPFRELAGRHRRIILQGYGDNWIPVYKPTSSRKKNAEPELDFKFQYSGLYPALDIASRILPSLRVKLSGLRAEIECPTCGGSRLRPDASAVRLKGRSADELCRMPLNKLYDEIVNWNLTATEQKIAGDIRNDILSRIRFLLDVGLDYLTLSRPAMSLSGGEMQRIRLASQIGSGLCGALYVLDEPTIGLHPRDNAKLLNALRNLRDLGNTVLVVEHDKEIIAGADDVLDFGPGAGVYGGELIAQGTPEKLASNPNSVTGAYLSAAKSIPVPANRRPIPGGELYKLAISNEQLAINAKRLNNSEFRIPNSEFKSSQLATSLGRWLTINGVRQNNLKNIDVHIPVGAFTVVTGVSGSGKSSLVENVLYNGMARLLQRSTVSAGQFRNIIGIEHFNKVINVDQRPIGQTPLSNLATYTGAFDYIRNLYASLPEARIKGFTARRFSFNAPGGRCEKCEGYGQIKVEMHFLPDVWVNCDACNGQRYEPETLSVKYHGFSIADALNLSCKEALTLFNSQPPIRRILQTLCDVGLDYLALGQPAPTLSGGEAQRIKLASELSRPDTGRTLYVLDEPTTGLHFEDLLKLLDVLQRLVDFGNTVVVIEHNLDVIKSADWIIDLGPEAGENGGEIVCVGTPEDVVKYAKAQQKAKSGAISYTGLALEPELEKGTYVKREKKEREKITLTPMEIEQATDYSAIVCDIKTPWETDGVKWHTEERIAQNGRHCRWDGAILLHTVEYIDSKDILAAPDWNDRTTVSVALPKVPAVWFFRAITNEEWLLKLKFQVPKGTFTQEELDKQLDLKPLNDMPELPLYGAHTRVRVETAHDPRFQEIELKVHYLKEINRPEFWSFIDKAIEAFNSEFGIRNLELRSNSESLQRSPDNAQPMPNSAEPKTSRTLREDSSSKLQSNSELRNPNIELQNAAQPWKILGRTWHLMPSKGFHKNRRPKWKAALLTAVVTWLEQAFNDAQFGWTNKCVVPIKLPGAKSKGKTWAWLSTKQRDAIRLDIEVEKNKYSVGALLAVGQNVKLDDTKPNRDIIKVYFVKDDDLTDAVKQFIIQTRN